MEARSLLAALSGGLEGWAIAFFGEEAEGQLVSASAYRRQVWCAIWAQFSNRAERIKRPEDFSYWREAFKTCSSRELLRQAGFSESVGLQSALGKLGWMALDKAGAYLSIADTLQAGGPRRKLLHHLKTIDLRAIELVENLPYTGCSANSLAKLLTNKHVTPLTLSRRAWRLRRLALVDPQCAKLLTAGFATDASVEQGDLNIGLPFPAPPWIGSDNLRPIDTPQKLDAAALQFSNCLANQARYVWQGTAYFYQLGDDAVIEFERVTDLGWEIIQARGRKNQTLSALVHQSLVRALASAPPEISPILPRLGEAFVDA